MKIHGTAEGAALSKKDFGVAFSGATAPSEPIAFDAKATTNEASSEESITNENFTVADNSNRVLIACVARYDGSGGDVESITWNGDEEFEYSIHKDNSAARTEIWYLVDPTPATANIVTTWGAETERRGAGVYSFYNVSQDTNPIGVNPVANGTDQITTATITPTTTGSIVVDCNMSSSDEAASAQSQTLGWRSLIGGDDRTFSSQYALEPTIDSANNMFYTYGGVKTWTWCGVEVKQV